MVRDVRSRRGQAAGFLAQLRAVPQRSGRCGEPERQPHAGTGSGRRGAHLVGKPRRRHRPARPGDRPRRTLRRRPARRAGQGAVVRARRPLRPALGRIHARPPGIRIGKWKIPRHAGSRYARRCAGARTDESHRAGSVRCDLGVGVRQFRRSASHRSGESSRGALRREDRRPLRNAEVNQLGFDANGALLVASGAGLDRFGAAASTLRAGAGRPRRSASMRSRLPTTALVAARAGRPRTLSRQWRRIGADRAHRRRKWLAGADRRRPAGRFCRRCLGQQRARLVALRSARARGAGLRSSRRAGQFRVQPSADSAQGRRRHVCRYPGRDRRLPAAAHCGKCHTAASWCWTPSSCAGTIATKRSIPASANSTCAGTTATCASARGR